MKHIRDIPRAGGLTVRIVQVPIAKRTAMVLCDDQGRLLPNQQSAAYSDDVGGQKRLWIEFTFDDKRVRWFQEDGTEQPRPAVDGPPLRLAKIRGEGGRYCPVILDVDGKIIQDAVTGPFAEGGVVRANLHLDVDLDWLPLVEETGE